MVKVYMLPAGRGDFLIIEFLDELGEHYIFIDGGDKSAAALYKSALTWIKRKNKRIDAIIFTHNDDDHICGALCAIMNMKDMPVIKKIYFILGRTIQKRFHLKSETAYPETEEKEYLHVRSVQHSTKHALTLDEGLKAMGLENQMEDCVCMGDVIPIGRAQIKIISPGLRELEEYLNKWNQEIKEVENKSHSADKAESKVDLSYYAMEPEQRDGSVSNGSSIAFLFEYDEIRLAFLGDAHAEVCAEGLSKFYPSTVKTDMVKVSHHGSKYSYSDKLYRLLQTNYYLLSTKGTVKHPCPVFLGKLLGQNQSAQIICNGQWIRGYGFSEKDAKQYLNGKNPHIYQIRGKKIISPQLAVCGKFPDEELSHTEG